MFIFPSRYEGYGLPPLEAMRLGCPVLAFTAASIPEVCGHDAAAYFDPEDAIQLASAIADLVPNDAERARLIAAGHRRVEQMEWPVQGILYSRYRKSDALSLMLFPSVLVALFESLRYPYWGTSRAFVWLLGTLVVLTVLWICGSIGAATPSSNAHRSATS